MKCYLASGADSAPGIRRFGIGAGSTVLFVTTASEAEGPGPFAWLDRDRAGLQSTGATTRDFSFTGRSEVEIDEALAAVDAVWCAGGNTYYLLDQINRSGARSAIERFVAGGGVYAGSSAGAIIATPDIEPVAEADQRDAAPGLVSTAGLGFFDRFIAPHADCEELAAWHEQIRATTAADDVVFLRDDQALVIDGTACAIVTEV